MTGCENLCTADKCAELEERIKDLENKLEILKNDFDSHINQDIPDAHNYDLNLDNYVTKDEFQEHQNTEIPEAHNYKPAINLDVFGQENGEYAIKVQIDGESDQDTFSVTQIDDYVTQSEFQNHLNTDIPDAHNYEPPEYEPDLEITNFSTGDGSTRVVVSLDGRDVSTVLDNNQDITGDITSYLDNQNFYFSIDELSNNDYRFNITFGDKSRSEILDLPLSFGGGGTTEIPPTTVSINGDYDAENNNLNISVTVDGVSATKSINLDEMPFAAILACLEEIKEELEKEPETITIVASPEVQANIKGTVLVLDFTTVDAFPKLNATNSKWRVQIPAPIENITWNDLEGIRWFRGSQYARMKFTGRSNYCAGWFRDENAADSYFAQIAPLSSLQVSNIIKPKHSNPKISPNIIQTRVYRAFKVFIDDNGEPDQTLTEVFRPPTEENPDESL